MYLRDRAGKDGSCYPAISTIAQDLKMSRSTVKRALGDLEKAKYIRHERRYAQTAAQSAVFSMLFSFGKLISDDYNRSLHGQELRTEHKLKAAIRRKKQALGMKENPLENPQFKR